MRRTKVVAAQSRLKQYRTRSQALLGNALPQRLCLTLSKHFIYNLPAPINSPNLCVGGCQSQEIWPSEWQTRQFDECSSEDGAPMRTAADLIAISSLPLMLASAILVAFLQLSWPLNIIVVFRPALVLLCFACYVVLTARD